MMLKIKKSSDRGHTQLDWLESKHSFSFGDYYNPREMSYGPLRVINEDKIKAKKGFGFHPHKNMEIITFMLSGKIQHQDNMGNIGNLTAGNAQLMRAGTGVVHSEMNAFDQEAHLLQIWIAPDENNLTPGWWEKEFNSDKGLDVIVEPIVKTNQIAKLNNFISGQGLQMAQNGYILKVSQDASLDFSEFGNSFVYFHQATGTGFIDKQELNAGDSASAELAQNIDINTQEGILLVFIFPDVL